MKDSDFDRYLEEEELFLKEHKLYRKERKLKSKKDLSKYKKTNLKKSKCIPSKEDPHLKKAIVLSVMGSEVIASLNGSHYTCYLRGFLKKEKTQNKNLITVGDSVNIKIIPSSKEATIESIDERKNTLARVDEKTNKRKIIASNIDQVIITASVVLPELKPFLITRYIIAAEMQNMLPIIVINKIDLLKTSPKEKARFDEFMQAYENLGYKIFLISCKKKQGLKELLNQMKGKKSVFSGHSGTGKTSIINALFKKNFKTGKVTKKTLKGAHITTRAKLLELDSNSFYIDTPGIKSFSIWDLSEKDIKNHFSDIEKFAKNCRYPGCKHISEPDCSVIKAFEENKIPPLRFEAYRDLMEEVTEKKRMQHE